MNLIPNGLYGEEYAEDIAFLIKPKTILGEVKSKYQTSTIIDTETFGRVVFQDGLVYVADKGNESIYETYTHIPMQIGKPKRKVLLIGGGDGFGIKRILDYKSVEKLVAIDIDKDFVELSNKVFPETLKYKNDPRVEFLYIDGADYVREVNEKFDFVLITVGDPFTVSKTMFTEEFFKRIPEILTEDGIFCVDGFMPYYTHEDVLNYYDIFELVSKNFPITKIATATSPLMPGGLVTFIFGSKTDDPSVNPRTDVPVKTFWYNKEIHTSSFVLPEFMREKLKSIKGFVQ